MIEMVEEDPVVLFVWLELYINNGTISAKGGTGLKLPSGGGGRVAFNFRSGVTRGTLSMWALEIIQVQYPKTPRL